MYNLIVTAETGAWEGSSYEFELLRVMEHTDDAIAKKYKPLDQSAIEELKSFPVLFAYETKGNAGAQLGRLTRVRKREEEVRIDFEIYSEIPSISPAKLAELSWDLEIGNWEMNRTHWAVKTVDLLAVLVEAGLITSERVSRLPGQRAVVARSGKLSHSVSSVLFETNGLLQEPDLVAVMMPFDAEFAPIYTSIRLACEEVGQRCLRADDIWQESIIMQDIFNLIVRSRVVIVDFSTKNPNVMYETGIAHTVGRPVIPISQSLADVPFDLRHHRVLKYLPNTEGLAAMQSILTERLKTLVGKNSRP